jgi:hypothetical protein
MARVKDQAEASNITIVSKNRRWARLASLFDIKRLSELFPANSVPNDAGNDHLKCSGDVLRDLCMIGEALSKRGMKKEQMRGRVKRSFTPGILVRHADIRELLVRVRNSALQTAIQTGYDKDFVVSQQIKSDDADATAAVVPGDAFADAVEGGDEATNRRERPADGAIESTLADRITDEQPFPALDGEGDEAIHASIEGKSEELQSADTASPPFSIFDDIEPVGPRKAKARAYVGITEITEMEAYRDDHNDKGQDAELEYEEDDVIPAHITQTTATDSKYLSSLRPRDEDGFADSYVPGEHDASKAKFGKRKSAPADLETGRKRTRSSYTPSSATYDQTERDTLVSCLRMTHALLTSIDQHLVDDDVYGAQKQVDIVQGMVEQVLKHYTE